VDLRKEANDEAAGRDIRGTTAGGEMEAEAEAARRFSFHGSWRRGRD